MKRVFLFAFVLISFSLSLYPQNENNETQFLIRCDDSGMSNATNRALLKLIESGIPFSTSVMFVCPWRNEAIEILKNNPHISVGVHLTLNSEWKNYKWGPILGKTIVPSLVNKEGYFFPSRKAFFDNNPKADEVELELRAQIELALNSGLQIDYIDYHMGAAVSSAEFRDIVEKLAAEYRLGISRYFEEFYSENMYSHPIESKKDSLISIINNKLDKGKINLFVSHIGIDNDELRAMEDLNDFGLKNMSGHRQAELNALLSNEFIETLKANRIKLITYREIIKKYGLENMKRPESLNY